MTYSCIIVCLKRTFKRVKDAMVNNGQLLLLDTTYKATLATVEMRFSPQSISAYELAAS